jgi:hypothetical protein
MTDRKKSWENDKAVARGILRDRTARRKLIFRMLMAALGMMAGGLWVVDRWLAGDPWRFLIWWAVCAVLTGLVMVFALYDALAVIREERGK